MLAENQRKHSESVYLYCLPSQRVSGKGHWVTDGFGWRFLVMDHKMAILFYDHKIGLVLRTCFHVCHEPHTYFHFFHFVEIKYIMKEP